MKDYPYMYARASAKKAKLYTEKDYERFLKMEVNEISRKMEEGEYSEEINYFGSEYNGADLIERSLNRNLANTLENLLKISSEDAKPMIRAYLRRFDIINLKQIIRWKQTDGEEKIEHLLYPIGTMGLSFEKIREDSLEEIIEFIGFPDSEADYSKEIEECESPKEIEACLDRVYAKEIRDIADDTRSKEFKAFVESEQLYQDIGIALRLKKYGASPEDIMSRLITYNREVEDIVNAEEFEEAMKKARELTGAEGEDLEEFEHSMEQRRLQEALATLHREPLGLSSIIGYMVAKTIEIENLRMIARAKETGIQNNETIRQNLVLS
ncbi:MAG: V-type ATPase subunit [Candidatus Nanohaloarchaea archaeon]